MTWNELAAKIAKLSPEDRTCDVRLVRDLDGPDQQVYRLNVTVADRDIYHGMSIGSELTFVAGHPFLEVDR
jgi:hypothetical protein